MINEGVKQKLKSMNSTLLVKLERKSNLSAIYYLVSYNSKMWEKFQLYIFLSL